MSSLKTLSNVREIVYDFLAPYGIIPTFNEWRNFNGRPEIQIEINGDRATILSPDRFHGMAMLYCPVADDWNVFEYMAGKNENELWEYKTTKYLKTALKELLKGNKRKPIKIWT